MPKISHMQRSASPRGVRVGKSFFELWAVFLRRDSERNASCRYRNEISTDEGKFLELVNVSNSVLLVWSLYSTSNYTKNVGKRESLTERVFN